MLDNPPSLDNPSALAADDLITLCVQEKLFEASSVSEIVQETQKSNVSVINYLVSNKKYQPQRVAEIVGKYLVLPVLTAEQLTQYQPVTDVLDDTFIQQNRVLPLTINDTQLCLAIAEPIHPALINEIKFYTDLNVNFVVTEWHKLSELLDNYQNEFKQTAVQTRQSFTHPNALNDDSIIDFVQYILLAAIKKGASDIHFEPSKTSYRIRLRIDGILHKISQINLELANRITTRLKVMSKLDIAERRLPQDGRFNIHMTAQDTKNCRINTCPTLFGEKTVIRILTPQKTSLDIHGMGFTTEQANLFIHAIQQSQGMILVTGPTGSGKTTTLYAGLNLINSLDKNISTVEEPVEIELPGINQVNVNTKIDLTFSKTLRALLRQDPDVIMIGEIRDKETAEIAMKAAQTGHLVISTLHTNNAAETLTRLLMMGISAFHIAHSINLIIAQRLVRKLCDFCKRSKQYTPHLLIEAGMQKNEIAELVLYEAVGCSHCIQGYSGRLGIYELLPITPLITHLIMQNTATAEIAAAGKKLGMINLQQAALQKVKAGLTTFAEMRRVLLT